MKNFVQSGQVITLTAPADVTSGQLVKVGSLMGVAQADAVSGTDVECVVYGVFDLPKATGAVSQGAKVYWDATNSVVTTTATGNTLLGAATQAAQSADATARVLLNVNIS